MNHTFADAERSEILGRVFSILRMLRQLLRAVRMRHRGLRYAARLARSGEDIQLDLGCGASSAYPGFIGLDLHPGADIQWDIRWGLPFPNESVSGIRSDHFFEHLALSEVVGIFCECRRVLAPAGVLDFTVPHLEPYIDAYLRRDFQFLQERISDIPDGQEELYNTCFDRIAWLLHRGSEHRSLFDRDSIMAKLRVAGFADVTTREYDPDRDACRRFSSIYVVARK